MASFGFRKSLRSNVVVYFKATSSFWVKGSPSKIYWHLPWKALLLSPSETLHIFLREQENGVPQEEPLSLSLFFLAVQSAFKVLPKYLKPLFLADYIKLFIRSKSIGSALKIMQTDIDNLNSLAGKNGFTFSTTKTTCLVFTNKWKTQLNLV